MPYANNKGADQPAYLRSLISAIVVRCLDSIIPLVSLSEISSLYQASVAEQVGLSLAPKTGFLASRIILSTCLVNMHFNDFRIFSVRLDTRRILKCCF